MKMPTTIQLLALCVATTILPLSSFAQKGGNGGERESRMLLHLLHMDDAELMKLRQTVERIEAMSPEERAQMRERLGKLQEMDPERRQALRERFQAIPKEAREAMRQRWMDMSPQEHREWRQKLREMSPEERADAMEAAGIMPPRRNGKMRGEQGRSPEGQGPRSERRGPPPPLD